MSSQPAECRVKGRVIKTVPNDTGFKLSRGPIIVYTIEDSNEPGMYFSRDGRWTKKIYMCDTFAECELEDFIAQHRDQPAEPADGTAPPASDPSAWFDLPNHWGHWIRKRRHYWVFGRQPWAQPIDAGGLPRGDDDMIPVRDLPQGGWKFATADDCRGVKTCGSTEYSVAPPAGDTTSEMTTMTHERFEEIIGVPSYDQLAAELTRLREENATAKKQITEAIGLCDATADWDQIAIVTAGRIGTLQGKLTRLREENERLRQERDEATAASALRLGCLEYVEQQCTLKMKPHFSYGPQRVYEAIADAKSPDVGRELLRNYEAVRQAFSSVSASLTRRMLIDFQSYGSCEEVPKRIEALCVERDSITARAEQAEARLAACEALEEKWRDEAEGRDGIGRAAYIRCADEIGAALKQEPKQ